MGCGDQYTVGTGNRKSQKLRKCEFHHFRLRILRSTEHVDSHSAHQPINSDGHAPVHSFINNSYFYKILSSFHVQCIMCTYFLSTDIFSLQQLAYWSYKERPTCVCCKMGACFFTTCAGSYALSAKPNTKAVTFYSPLPILPSACICLPVLHLPQATSYWRIFCSTLKDWGLGWVGVIER